MEQQGRKIDAEEKCPSRMTINTFTHDYYILELPENHANPFYAQFSFYCDLRDYKGGHIPVAPVARIYGTNQYGQKCCCHIHGFFPHFFIKTQEYTQAFKTDPEFLKSFLMVLEGLFQRAYSINKPIIAFGETQNWLDFYGYHEHPECFLKISLYDPSHVVKMRELLDSQILGRSFQCYEAHMNYFMQLFSERNIFGINEMNITDFTFRRNMDSEIMQLFRKVNFETRDMHFAGYDVIQLEKKFPHAFNSLVKISSCFVEVDFHIDGILNSFDDNYELEEESHLDSSMDMDEYELGQGKRRFKVKITRALEQVWLDERKRRINFGISEKPQGIIDYSKNLQGKYLTSQKDPLWINFLHKGSNRDQLISMLKSSAQGTLRQQTNQLTINRQVAENYNDVLHQEREGLIQKVQKRWKYYDKRKMKIISEMMTGERGQLPEWVDDEDNHQLLSEQESEESDKQGESNEQAPMVISESVSRSGQKAQPGNTALYRNNYKHVRATLKSQSFFHVCQFCRLMARDCVCGQSGSMNSTQQQTKVKPTNKSRQVNKSKSIGLKYSVPAPTYDEVVEGMEVTPQKPFYSSFKDLFQYHRINPIFPICLKTAQILDRQLKVIKQYNRDPISIRNELKLPYFFNYYISLPKPHLTPATYRLKYEPPPPTLDEVVKSIPALQHEEQLRPGRQTSLKLMKQDTFLSDLLVFHYQFVVGMDKESSTYYGDPEKNQIICLSYSIANFKDYKVVSNGLLLVDKYVDKAAVDDWEYDDIFLVKDQRSLLVILINVIFRLDPDILITYDQEKRGIRYLTQRGFQQGINIQALLSRTCELDDLFEYINFRDFKMMKQTFLKREILLSGNLLQKRSKNSNKTPELAFLERRMKESLKKKPILRKKYRFDVVVKGRVNLNIYRVCEAELKIQSYSLEAVSSHLFGQQLCEFTDRQLFRLYSQQTVFKKSDRKGINFVLSYVRKRLEMQARIIVNLNIISVVIEKSKIFGADFISMMQRGSQFKIESVMCRVTKKSGYLTLSASKKQVANQSVLECRPLVIEPPKEFFAQPVLLFDFQSLYPSVMIAYNICYSTCLGSIYNLFNEQKKKRLGVSQSINLDIKFLEQLLVGCDKDKLEKILEHYVFITPNKVAFVKKNIRQGVIPRILLEFLISRIMIKQSLGLYSKEKVKKLLKDRQYALKIFMNVMFGYTGASFSGRMPCSEIADSVVEVAKYSLRQVIDYLNSHPKYKGKVLYGDTDSVFFQMPGYSIHQALKIGQQLATEMTGLFPYPMQMKFEKVYDGLFLVAKKRYYGRSYQPGSDLPKCEGKGLQCVRRDGINFTSNLMKEMLNLLIETKDLSQLKSRFKKECSLILSNEKIESEFALAKEVKLIKYSEKSTPGHGEAAKRLEKIDPMLVPKYGQRMKYMIIAGGLKAIKHRSISVFEYMLSNRMNLDLEYYLKKQVIPPMQRVLSSLANLEEWVASIEVKHTEEMKTCSEIQLNKKCLRCKGETYFVLCQKCLSHTDEQITKIQSKKSNCNKICEECIGHGSPGHASKCVEWNCDQLWVRKKVQKAYNSVHPELIRLRQAMRALDF